jgi:hypothetical protein
MRRLAVGWGVLATWAALAALGVALWNQWLVVPDRWNPWAPLRPADEPNVLTGYKLSRLANDAAACRSALRATGLSIEVQPDRAVLRGCGWSNSVRITALPARVNAPFVLQCPAAVGLAMWERHVVQPLAREHLGQAVTGLEQLGSFACRNIGGEGGPRRSEHATANALDVAGFTLADGRSVRVSRDWDRDDASGRFLRAVHRGGCRYWAVVLGPDYNAAHRDHFHLDRGAFRACR